MAWWWYGGDGPHLPSMPFEAALQSRGTGKAGENGQSSLAPGRGRRIRPSVPPRGNSGGPPGALAPCGWLRKWRSGCRGSLSTGSPAGHLNMGDADEAPMHGGSMYSQAQVSPGGNQAPRCEHGLGTKAKPEKGQARNPEGGGLDRVWVPPPQGGNLGREEPNTVQPGRRQEWEPQPSVGTLGALTQAHPNAMERVQPRGATGGGNPNDGKPKDSWSRLGSWAGLAKKMKFKNPPNEATKCHPNVRHCKYRGW